MSGTEHGLSTSSEVLSILAASLTAKARVHQHGRLWGVVRNVPIFAGAPGLCLLSHEQAQVLREPSCGRAAFM